MEVYLGGELGTKLMEFGRGHKKNLEEAIKLRSEFTQRYPFKEHIRRRSKSLHLKKSIALGYRIIS